MTHTPHYVKVVRQIGTVHFLQQFDFRSCLVSKRRFVLDDLNSNSRRCRSVKRLRNLEVHIGIHDDDS